MKKTLKILLVLVIIAAIVTIAVPKYRVNRTEAPDLSVRDVVHKVENLFLNYLSNTKKNEEQKDDAEEATAEEDRILNGPYSVVRVIDGDTAIISIDGEEKRVRFIGIDTPESVNPDESKNTEEGKQASQFTKELLTDQSVYLEYDIEREDAYGRTLAYVYLSDGETRVQDLILQAGLATTMTIQPNSKYADDFHAIQVQAREAQVGFWATGFFN